MSDPYKLDCEISPSFESCKFYVKIEYLAKLPHVLFESIS